MDTNRCGYLKVDDIHEIYWEESGNPNGVPILFLHGGPGAGTTPNVRRFFDPESYRIIIFDQRGAGRSKPSGEIRQNNTQKLINDIEILRDFLNVRKWIIFGGSWGSTLALIYGQHFPQNCVGFILRGVFLFSDEEVNWFLRGIRMFFPREWKNFAEHIGESETNNLLKKYYIKLNSNNPRERNLAAIAWCNYENSCSRLIPKDFYRLSLQNVRPEDLAMARIEAHYMINKGFLKKNQIIKNLNLISSHPAIIINGRYDIICPIFTAELLHKNWPRSEIITVPNAGHSSMESGIRTELINATNKFRTKV